MKHPVYAPSVGESITEVSILKWTKNSGERIEAGQLLLEIESDKATVEIVAEFSGALEILKAEGERVPVGEIIAQINPEATGTVAAPVASKTPAPTSTPTPTSSPGSFQPGPAARKMAADNHIDLEKVTGTGKDQRVTQEDLQKHLQIKSTPPTPTHRPTVDQPGDRRVPMSNLRARIAERLVQAQHTAAILTTFNEVDMSAIMQIRNQSKDAFKAKHGVALSFMSFFTLATKESLKLIPELNASLEGRDIVYHSHYNIGIAVGTEKGLVVPIVHETENLGLIELEKKIAQLALKARDGKLSIADMSGGTFTISNGGVYGSLMSTPILTPPQTGILGMHKIQDRPMAVNGKIEIRPMMYLALSYDHRIIDGKGAVTFLVTLKDFLEHPEKLRLEF